MVRTTGQNNTAQNNTAQNNTANGLPLRRWMQLLGLAAAMAVVATGCGAIAENVAEEAIEQAAESEGGGDVEIDFDNDDGTFSIETEEGTVEFSGDENGGSYTFESEDGSGEMTFGADVERPDCLPSFDVPDEFVAESAVDSDGLCTFTGFVTSGSIDDYADVYEEMLRDFGYTEQSSRASFAGEGMETVSISAQTSDGKYGSIGISALEEYYSVSTDEDLSAIVFNFLFEGG